MRMTDVITGLRDNRGPLVDSMTRCSVLFDEVRNLAQDASTCNSDAGRKAILEKLYVRVLETKDEFAKANTAAADSVAVLDKYTRVFEQVPKGPKVDPNQTELPGPSDPEPPAEGLLVHVDETVEEA